MPGPSIESFCERCGTKYTFEPPQQRGKRLKGLGRTLGLLAENAEPESVGPVASRDPFHGTFHFCLDCRQYTCPSCWNEAAGFCQGCVPLPESPDLGGAEAFAALEAESQIRDAAVEHRLMGLPEAWPGVDLPQPEVEPEPVMAVAAAPEPEPEYAAEPEPQVELVYQTEPVVEAEPETVRAELTRVLAELNQVTAEAKPVVEAEMAAVDAKAEVGAADAEPVAAAAALEATEAAAPAEPMPLAAAATDGAVEPDGLFDRAWDILYTQSATAEMAEENPSAVDWAALAPELPTEIKVEAKPVAEPVAAAEPVPEPELVAFAEPVPEPELVAFAEPVAAAERVAVAQPEPAMPIAAAQPPVAPPAPIQMPPVIEPARPVEPRLSPGWRMTAPDEPSAVWPPHAPVYRPPTTTQPQASLIHPQMNGGNQPAAAGNGGHAASGIRPCYQCALPLSASARFCRRCGTAQQAVGV